MTDGEVHTNAASFAAAYRTEDTYPGKPWARIYIDGLLCLCFDGDRKCTVGVNQQPKHTLVFEIWKRVGASGCEKIVANLPAGFKEVAINVGRASPVVSPVKVYTGPSLAAPSEERHNLVAYSVDFEASRGHDTAIKNKPGTLWPRFYINDGLFCGYKLSVSTFELANAHKTVVLGSVALATVADIFLRDPSDYIEVLADGNPLTPPVKLTFGHAYEIGITNLCDGCAKGESDFQSHYAVLDVGSESPFDLRTRSDSGSYARTPLGNCVGRERPDPVSDSTPCMSIVFGQTKTFNL